MRDSNLILTDNNKTSSAFAANALAVNKTPAAGIWLMFKITKNSANADGRIEAEIFAKDTDASWATTDDEVGHLPLQGSGVAQNATIIRFAKVTTKKAYVKPRYVISGTSPDFSIECSVVSGPQRDTTA